MKLRNITRAIVRVGVSSLLLTSLAAPSRAGEWVLDRYVCNISESHWDRRQGAIPGHDIEGHYDAGVDEQSAAGSPFIRQASEVPYVQASAQSVGSGYGATMSIKPASVSMSVTPIYVWQGDDEPAKEFYVIESGFASIAQQYSSTDFNSLENPYDGRYLSTETSKVDDGFGDGPVDSKYADEASRKATRKPTILTIQSGGARQVSGATRCLTATACSKPAPMGNISTNAAVVYKAEICKFSLDASAVDVFRDSSPGLLDRQLAAYVGKAWTVPVYAADDQKPIEFYWDGHAHYTPSLSSNLFQVFGTPKYTWSLAGGEYSSATETTVPWSLSLAEYAQGLTATPAFSRQQIPEMDPTVDKDIHHNVQSYIMSHQDSHGNWSQPVHNTGADTWPAKTQTRVIISGSQTDAPIFPAKANIDWYLRPNTKYRCQMVTKYINLDTGDIAYAPAAGEGAGPESEDADPADVYAQEVLAAKKDFFDAEVTYVGGPLELGATAYETAFDIIIPDKYDLALLAVDNAPGELFHKVFKVSETAVKFAEIATKIGEKLGSKSEKILKAGRNLLGVSDEVPVIAMTEMEFVRVERGGKLIEKDEREAADMGEVTKEFKWLGEFCFVKGTPVLMADGRLKAVEQIKVGEKVISKDESSGVVAPQRVSRLTQRVAPSTLAIKFANGETIGTTVEHPFYEEHKGFVPAGLLAVGNSIVTRAGPSAKIESIEKRKGPHTVYNFTVEDFHTYFVGRSNLWVHNVLCEPLALGTNGGHLPLPAFTNEIVPGAVNHHTLGLDIYEIGRPKFAEEIRTAMSECPEIHFNLDGMRELDKIVYQGTQETLASTNWELQQVVGTPAFAAKAKFWTSVGSADGLPKAYDTIGEALTAMGYTVP